MKKKVGRTEYEVVETSTGRFRIKTIFHSNHGEIEGFLGGPKSKIYCFWIREEAEKAAAEWRVLDARIVEHLKGDRK